MRVANGNIIYPIVDYHLFRPVITVSESNRSTTRLQCYVHFYQHCRATRNCQRLKFYAYPSPIWHISIIYCRCKLCLLITTLVITSISSCKILNLPDIIQSLDNRSKMSRVGIVLPIATTPASWWCCEPMPTHTVCTD